MQRLALSRKKKGKKAGTGGQNDGEFDDLISALRTGDVFSEDMTKMKKMRKRSVPQKNLIQQSTNGTNGNGRKTSEMSRERVGMKPKPGSAVSVTSRTGAF